MSQDDDETFSVSLGLLEWAEVSAALTQYIQESKDAPSSQRDALLALRKIDQAMTGSTELPPADDVLGVGGIGDREVARADLRAIIHGAPDELHVVELLESFQFVVSLDHVTLDAPQALRLFKVAKEVLS